MWKVFRKLDEATRELVFGVEDGLVSTMGAVAGIAAGTQNAKIVILSGAVIIVVESLSMAAGSYLSSKSHRQAMEKRIREEEREIEEKPEEEKEELRVMYRERGFTEEEVAMLVNRVTQDKDLWLEEMVAKELKIGELERESPRFGALVMGLAYAVGGAVPVLPYLFLPVGTAFGISIAATVLALFLVGWLKGRFTGTDPWKGGFEMMVVATGAALLGYLIGAFIGETFGLNA